MGVLTADKTYTFKEVRAPKGYKKAKAVKLKVADSGEFQVVKVKDKAYVCTPQHFCLKEHLQTLQNEYDYCIIDTNSSISIVNINGLVAADTIYVPLRCDGGFLLRAAIV